MFSPLLRILFLEAGVSRIRIFVGVFVSVE